MDSTQHEHPEMADVETVNGEYDETFGPPRDFWRARTIGEIAAQQGIAVPQPLDQVIGAAAELWEDDGDCERFVRGIHDRRLAQGGASAGGAVSTLVLDTK